ncbi:SubName: Full=Uncharacterized protein {ECO:0000313/EMBL:CCA71591.1} [Serendipita indica DSM 11827]|nr:SubName: Full=Uncharacterized protein {ECO:0000313/EMBL:CCA71591.1} [Serendipita indica DSM 11827]
MTSVKPRPSDALAREGPSEFEILKRNHKFLREDEQDVETAGSKSWDEALARKFYSNLWKEYALCDLKHYKSGNFALRWRTEDEVVEGIGETSCANTRCKHHAPKDSRKDFGRQSAKASSSSRHKEKALHTLELPFGYVEDGALKSALVKVVLCDRCVKKIMWKRRQERDGEKQAENDEESDSGHSRVSEGRLGKREDSSSRQSGHRRYTEEERSRSSGDRRKHRERSAHRPRTSRSRSPERSKRKRNREE